MARLAIIVHEGNPGPRELRLGSILEFFGVPWKCADISNPWVVGNSSAEYAVFGPLRLVAAALKEHPWADSKALPPAAFYAFTDDQRTVCESALRSLLGDVHLSLQDAPPENVLLRISGEMEAGITGSMAGLELSLRLRAEDAVLMVPAGAKDRFDTLISAGDAPVFIRFLHEDIPVFFCASLEMVDIDQPVGQGFYDVKRHFCSAVPLVMFIRSVFSEVAWRPQELGACLIIDDPLLKLRYGFCNFAELRDQMREHGFTTNIAFIPWNWRRTSAAASAFFKKESELFSVSIHGCDHTGGEFGSTSPDVLQFSAQLARSRMENHERRTGIQHDSIMVFPQGVFSSACPAVLKRSGFLAAVNTETIPVDVQNARTRIRDAWDVAIMSYGGFSIFTRRYAFHGLENFAFDLLLGKPCLIVAHHDSFKDGGPDLIAMIEKIRALNCRVHWRPLGQVIQRACRLRGNCAGLQEVEMYGNVLAFDNTSDQPMEVRIHKKKSDNDHPSEILCDDKPIAWASEGENFTFGARISPKREAHFRVVYPSLERQENSTRSLRFEMAVAARRILSEFRDNYLCKNPLLSASVNTLRSVLR